MYLGIDFGLKNIGLAIASGPLAEPLRVIKNSPKVNQELHQICDRMQIKKIVVGLPEGRIAEAARKFAVSINKTLKIPVAFQDETFTTKIAAKNLIEAKAKKTKRQGPKHAYAATVILQEYLDTINHKANQER